MSKKKVNKVIGNEIINSNESNKQETWQIIKTLCEVRSEENENILKFWFKEAESKIAMLITKLDVALNVEQFKFYLIYLTCHYFSLYKQSKHGNIASEKLGDTSIHYYKNNANLDLTQTIFGEMIVSRFGKKNLFKNENKNEKLYHNFFAL